jgi:truncated hemoglobin YjbI
MIKVFVDKMASDPELTKYFDKDMNKERHYKYLGNYFTSLINSEEVRPLQEIH